MIQKVLDTDRQISDGKINPEVSDSFSLDDGALAIAHLKDRKAKGKVIIKI